MSLPCNLLSRSLIWMYLFLLPLCLSAEVVRTFEYNKNNQVIKEVKANGHSIAYEYDPCGRVIKETATDGAVVQYLYDKNGNCIQTIDRHGTTSYTYDRFNQLTAVQFQDFNPLLYKYDVRNRLIEISYPNGWKVFYLYDSSDRLVSVIDQTGTTKYDYDEMSNTLVKVTLSNRVYTEYQYDRVKRIREVTHKRSNGEVITNFSYIFDANGNRTQIKETGPSGTKTTVCAYDKLNRLISLEHSEGFEKYTYDALGNRLSKETKIGIIHYEYDEHLRLQRIVLPNGTIREIAYDTINRPTKELW